MTVPLSCSIRHRSLFIIATFLKVGLAINFSAFRPFVTSDTFIRLRTFSNDLPVTNKLNDFFFLLNGMKKQKITVDAVIGQLVETLLEF